MRKLIIKIGIPALVLGTVAAIYVYSFVINKSHPDYRNMKPEYVMLAHDMFENYKNDRISAESVYNGKMVQLNGTLDKIESNDSLLVGIFVFDQGMFGDEGIRCTLLPGPGSELDNLASGSEVRIKGFVTGYNETDVILEKCSIVN